MISRVLFSLYMTSGLCFAHHLPIVMPRKKVVGGPGFYCVPECRRRGPYVSLSGLRRHQNKCKDFDDSLTNTLREMETLKERDRREAEERERQRDLETEMMDAGGPVELADVCDCIRLGFADNLYLDII